VTWYWAEGCEVDRARQALRLRGLLPWPREDVYSAMIRCTADPRRVDKRTRSKWSRVRGRRVMTTLPPPARQNWLRVRSRGLESGMRS
jgi:hypothetical protein